MKQSVEEVPFCFLLQDKQHTQPRSRRATEAPALADGPGREGSQDRGQRHGAGQGWWLTAADTATRGRAGPVVQHHRQWQPRGAGRGAGLLHVGL